MLVKILGRFCFCANKISMLASMFFLQTNAFQKYRNLIFMAIFKNYN